MTRRRPAARVLVEGDQAEEPFLLEDVLTKES